MKKNLTNTGGLGSSEDGEPGSGSSTNEIVDKQAKQIASLNSLAVTYQATTNDLRKQIENLHKSLSSQTKDLKQLDEKIKASEERVRAGELRSIEVIGIISSIIALVLIFVSSAHDQKELVNSYILLSTGTASLILFACMLHVFFNQDYNKEKTFWWLFSFAILIFVFSGYLVWLKENQKQILPQRESAQTMITENGEKK